MPDSASHNSSSAPSAHHLYKIAKRKQAAFLRKTAVIPGRYLSICKINGRKVAVKSWRQFRRFH